MGEKGVNGNPELVSGINLIVSIPPREYIGAVFPKAFWSLFQNFLPEMGF